MTGGKLRALTLTVIMVTSVMTAGVTLTGTAAANHGASAITVDDDGGADYSSIQAAIDHASSGDTIEVDPGTYSEQLTIGTSNLRLTSTGSRANTVISGAGATNVIKIQPDATNVTIDGFTIQDGERRGIFVGDFNDAPKDTTIRDNRIHAIGQGTAAEETHGILVETGADDSVVEGNLIENIEDGGTDRAVGISVVSQTSPGVDSVEIRGNTIRDVVTVENRTDHDEKARGIELVGKVTNILIEDNEVYDIGDPSSTSKPRGMAILEHDSIDGNEHGPSNFTIQDNTIHTIHSDGVYPATAVFFGGYETTFGSAHAVTQNSIEGDAFEVYTFNDEELNAEGNYWGSADGPSGDGPGSGTYIYTDVAGTSVDYSPWLDAPDGTATSPVENVDSDTYYSSIQAAIDNASTGDTIKVSPGTYGGFVADKQVTIAGEGPANITGPVKVSADGSTLRGLAWDGVGASPILNITGEGTTVDSIRMVNVPATSPRSSSIVVRGDDTIIRDNEFSRTGDEGHSFIALFQGKNTVVSTASPDNTSIVNNSLDGGDIGVFLEPSQSVTIRNNSITPAPSDDDAIWVTGPGYTSVDPTATLDIEDNGGLVMVDSRPAGANVHYMTSFQAAFESDQAGLQDGSVVDFPAETFTTAPVTVVNDSLTIRGAGQSHTTLDAGGSDVFELATNDTVITGFTVDNPKEAIEVDRPTPIDNLLVQDVTVRDANIAVYIQGNSPNTAADDDNGHFRGSTFTNVSLIDSQRKGFYIEKASDLVIESSLVSGVTSDTYGFNNGIDINLKDGDYQNISIRDTTVEGVEEGSPSKPSFSAAVAIKARGESTHTNYGAEPARLDNVNLEGVTIRDSFNGLRFGEPGSPYPEPSGITVQDTVFKNNVGYHIQDQRIGGDESTTSNNSFDTLAVAYDGQVPELPTTLWANIQDAVDSADDGGRVSVHPGTYEESVTISNENITLESTDGPQSTKIAADAYEGVMIKSSGVTVRGFTVTTNLDSTTTHGQYGIRLEPSVAVEDILIEENIVEDISDGYRPSGISLDMKNTPDETATNVTVRNNVIRNITGIPSSHEVVAKAINPNERFDGLVIEDNTIRNIGGEHVVGASAIDFSSDTGVDPNVGPKNFTIVGNDIDGISIGNEVPTIWKDEIALYLHDYGDLGDHRVENNRIRDGQVIYNTETVVDPDTLNATHNYWGAPSGPNGSYTGFGVSVSENVSVEPYYVDEGLTTLNTESTGMADIIVDDDGPSDFDTISAAVDAADPGDTISVRSGTYNESGITLDQPVSIIGSGMEHTVVDAKNSTSSGKLHVFVVRSNDTTIRGLTMTDGHDAIRISQSAHVENFTLRETKVNDSNIGMYVAGNAEDHANGEFDRVHFQDTHWIDNERKAIYLEKLSNATFEGLNIDGVAGPDYGFVNALDINLKGGNYTNITIRDSTVRNVAKGSPYDGNPSFSAAIAIKGRDDSSYSTNPGYLRGLTIDNVTIADSFNGLRFGEPGKAITTPENVTVVDSTFRNNTGFHFDDVTASPLEAGGLVENNEFASGSYVASNARISASVESGLDDASGGDTVAVIPDTYDEDLDVGNNLTVVGNGATIEGRVDLQTDGITFRGFTITNATAESRVDGIRISVDQDTDEQIVVENVTIERLRNQSTTEAVEGIHIYGSNPVDGVLIENVTIQDVVQPASGADGIKVQAGVSNVTVRDSTIQDIRGSWSYGVVSTPSSNLSLGLPTDVLVQNVKFSNVVGLDYDGVAVGIDSADGSITDTGVAPADETEVHNSSFVDVDYGVLNKDTGNVTDATFNYWGAPSGPSGAGPGTGVQVSENVTFQPFLGQPGGGPAAVSANRSKMAFGGVPATPDQSESKRLSVRLTSSGDEPLRLAAFELSGPDRGQFEFVAGDTPATLSPLETQTVTIAYVPTKRETASANLTVETNAAGQGTVTVQLSGEGTGPVLDVSTTEPVEFEADVGNTTTQTVSITNDGDRPLSVSGSADGTFTASGLPTTIAPGATASVSVEFAPSAGGIEAGRLSLSTNDSFATTRAVRLSGTGRAAGLDTSVPAGDTIEFGTVAVDATRSIDVIVTNDGTADLTISGVSVPGSAYSASVGTGTLAPGQSRAITVTAAPDATGNPTGTLTLSTNLGDTTWSLNGSAQARELDVTGSLDFGETPVGSTATADLQVDNTGTLPLQVDLQDAIDDSQFSLVGAPKQLTVPGGDSRTVTVSFSPAGTGDQTGTLTLETNDAGGIDDVDETSVPVTLAGNGTTSSLVVVGDSTLSFDSIAAGATETSSITLRNDGGAQINNLGAQLGGQNETLFTLGSVPSSLAGGSTTTIDVTYQPDAVGDHRATLSVSGSNGASTSAVLNGSAVPPAAELNRTSLDLGYVAVDGGTSTAAVEISNVDTHGTELTATASVQGSNAYSIASQPASPIASGGSSVVVVRYDPTAKGSQSATLEIATNDPDKPTLNVSLGGNGAEPEASPSPSPLAFGDVTYGETVTQELTVTNDGGVTLEITDASPAGTDAGQVSIVAGDTSTSLVPGETETYTVAVTPSQQTALSASVSVQTNANDLAVPVTATPAVPNASPSLSDGSTIDFDATRTGSATQKTLTVTNDGDAVLTLGEPSVTGAGAYSVVNAPSTAYLAPGESITYSLTFAPSAEGTVQATLTFDEVSDPDVGSLQFTLNGSGIEADARFSDASVSFGQVGVGTTRETTHSLENDGTAAYRVTGVSITGSDSAAFETDLATGTIVRPGDSVAFEVNATPSIRDSLSATLEVETNATGQALTSALGVTGIGPDIELDQSSVDFGETRLANATDRTIRVNNTGNAPLDVSDVSVSAGDTDQFAAVTGSVVVPAKGSRLLQVRFAPESTPADVTLAHQRADRTATLTVQSNDTDAAEQAVDVDMTGVGVSPAIELSQQDLKYGTVLVDSTTTRSVTLRNRLAGTASVRVTGASIQGQDADAYEVTTDPTGTVLQPGEQTTVGVEFTPTTPGGKYATLTLRTNDSRQDTQVVFLSNRDTVVRVTYGSVTMDYIDPVDGLQPAVDVYRGRALPAQMDRFQLATTQDADFNVTLEGDDQAFANAETSDAFDSIRYIEATGNATFDEDKFVNATFTFRVTKAALAGRDAGRSDVYLYHYDAGTGAYERLETQSIRETQSEYVYSAETTEFSEFSIGAAQPDLSLSNRQVSTRSITAGGSVDVTVDVANAGDAAGQQTVSLEVDGTTQSTRTVTVPAGGTEPVTFTVTLSQAGTYELGVNGTLAGTVEVSESTQPPVGGDGGDGGDGGSTPATTPAQPVQVLPPEVTQNLVQRTLTAAIEDADPASPGTTVRFQDQTGTVQEIVFENDLSGAGQVTVTELSDVPDAVRDAGESGGVVHAVDIAVPAGLENERATVTMNVPVSALDGADPADATIVHRQGDTWERLDTELVDVANGRATLRGQADGFSLFGVAVAPQQATATATPTATPEPPATDQPTATTEGPVQEPGGFDLSTIVLLVLGLMVLIAAIVLGRRRLT